MPDETRNKDIEVAADLARIREAGVSDQELRILMAFFMCGSARSAGETLGLHHLKVWRTVRKVNEKLEKAGLRPINPLRVKVHEMDGHQMDRRFTSDRRYNAAD